MCLNSKYNCAHKHILAAKSAICFHYNLSLKLNGYKKVQKQVLCHSYPLSPSFQGNLIIFENPISLKGRKERNNERGREKGRERELER